LRNSGCWAPTAGGVPRPPLAPSTRCSENFSMKNVGECPRLNSYEDSNNLLGRYPRNPRNPRTNFFCSLTPSAPSVILCSAYETIHFGIDTDRFAVFG